ncbi:MAG: GerAB/ArcD/ProY family transporter [Ruminococcus sp.]|nr:GerAB/ArcD/ProY family transporter [Ruminococcus sp.]
MQTKIKFPSKRLFFSLFLCASAVIFLQNTDLSHNNSFLFDALCIVTGLSIACLFFIPSIIIKKHTDLDFLSYAHIKTPSAIIFIAAFYGMYFVYTAVHFLLNYTDMFVKKLNPEANIYVIAFILLAVCVYGAFKGVNAITRCSIFIFAFSLIAYILFYTGNISNLDFSHYGFNLSGNANEFLSNTSFYLTISFVSVIFLSVSGYTKNFKTRHTVFTMIFVTLTAMLTMFFIRYALGDYANSQKYPAYVLSKSSHLGIVNGMDSFYLSITALSVFLTISLILSSISKLSGESSSLKMISIFAVIIFVMFICANYFNSVKEILMNPVVLNTLTFISAVLIPTVYMLIFWRKKNV